MLGLTGISCELIRNELRRKKLRDTEDLCTGDSKEESHRVEDVSHNQLERQRMDSEALSNPCQQPINRGHQTQNRQHIRQDAARNNQSKGSALGESVQGVGRWMLVGVATIDDDLTTSNGLFEFGRTDLGDGDGSGDGHDGRGDQVLCRYSKINVCG